MRRIEAKFKPLMALAIIADLEAPLVGLTRVLEFASICPSVSAYA